MQKIQLFKIIIISFISLINPFLHAQDNNTQQQTLQILNADILGQEKGICNINNSSQECEFQILKGNVALQIDKTIIHSDSIRINKLQKIIEAFNGIHIIDNKETHIYGKRLLYLGTPKKLWIYNNVKVINKNDTILTEELFYDKQNNICEYYNNGEIRSTTSTAKSQKAIYYNQTKKAILKNNVHIIDSAFNIYADSIQYTSPQQGQKNINFIALSEIIFNNQQKIYTDSGTYKIDSGQLTLFRYSKILDSNKLITAKNINYNKNSKTGTATTNFLYYDTSNNTLLKSDKSTFDFKTNNFIATQNVILRTIHQNQKDTFWLSADTILTKKISLKEWDSLKKNQTPKSLNPIFPQNNKKITTPKDSTKKINLSSKNLKKISPTTDTSYPIKKTDTTTPNTTTKTIDSNTSFRIINIHHNVKIFNDSIQAICDSLWYSDLDSTIQMLKQPTIWFNTKYQLTGDSILLYLKNNKIDSINVLPNALAIEWIKNKAFNQTKANKMTFYIDSLNKIKNIKALSNVSTIYFLSNDSNKIIAMNKVDANNLSITISNNKPQNINYYNNIKGTTYPINKLQKKDAFIPSFIWKDSLRPKNKYHIIQNKLNITLPQNNFFNDKKPYPQKTTK